MTFKHLYRRRFVYPVVDRIGVGCLQPGDDSLLHVDVCRKLLADQVLFERMVTELSLRGYGLPSPQSRSRAQ
jgi:hypothetical protein